MPVQQMTQEMIYDALYAALGLHRLSWISG